MLHLLRRHPQTAGARVPLVWGVVATVVAWRLWLALWSVWVMQLERPALKPGYLAGFEFPSSLPLWVTSWANFDGAVFMRIANGGYGHAELPFFPLLPMLMSGLQSVTGWSLPLSGLVISALVFPVGLYWAYKLWKLDRGNQSYLWFLLVLLSFPTAHYFTAVYQDALFFSLATGVVWFARQKRWSLSVGLACLAMLARLNGLALGVFLAAEYWLDVAPRLQKQWSLQSLWKNFAAAWNWKAWLSTHRYVWLFLLVPLPFLAYLGWIEWRFGDWNLFFTGVQVWNRDKLVLPPQTFWRYAKILALTASVSLIYMVAVLEAAFTALYGWVLLQQWGKLRLSYWLWIAAHFTIPVVTGTLQGMPRYGLHLYPLFLVLATWTISWPRWAKFGYLAACFVLQAWLAMWFLRGYFIA